jgi:hypothetical protein
VQPEGTDMGMKGMKEADVLRACLGYLRLRGFVHFRVNGGAMAVPASGGRKRFVRFTSARGVPDIIAVAPGSGRFIGIETKSPGGRLTPDQEAFANAVRKAGGISLCVRSVGDLAEELERLGGRP